MISEIISGVHLFTKYDFKIHQKNCVSRPLNSSGGSAPKERLKLRGVASKTRERPRGPHKGLHSKAGVRSGNACSGRRPGQLRAKPILWT